MYNQLYNLLIVEDEDNIRKGIENNNDWEGLGLKVVGSVSNGLEAFEFLTHNIVHVTLADIRMPKMDGLELMRQCKMIKHNTYFVFLSAYDTFQYAQTAINHGAKGYLLKPLKNTELEIIFKNIVDELNIQYRANEQHTDGTLNTLNEDYAITEIPNFVKKAMLYVNENYAEKYNLDSMSEIFYVSPEYFGTAFKKSTGMSFVDYYTSVKMNKAKELLTYLSYSIRDTAKKVGYDDYSYFCKLFKKYTGLTPLEYRRKVLLKQV